jgi:hypothetical protein
MYYESIPIPDFKVSWVGACRDLLCCGSESGTLRFVTTDGDLRLETHPISDLGEAINGFAEVGDFQAVSTRSDVTFISQLLSGLDRPNRLGPTDAGKVLAGVHGVIGTKNGYFVAPMGQQGLMIAKAGGAEEEHVYVSHDAVKDLYFYRSIPMSHSNGDCVIVSAIRRKGIAAGVFPSDMKTHAVNTVTPQDLDVIDICDLGQSLAVAALDKHGRILLFNDILDDKKPVNLKFGNIKGIAYRILASRGHLFVLTSKGFHVLANVVKRFLNKEPLNETVTYILSTPMSAIDATVFNDKFIFIINDKSGVFRLSLDNVEEGMPIQERIAFDRTLRNGIYWSNYKNDAEGVPAVIHRDIRNASLSLV